MKQLPPFPTDHLLSPATYRELVAQTLAALVEKTNEKLPLVQANGRVLAEDLQAPRSVPHFANSQMDGYALTVVGAARADRTFMIGADVPAGADTGELPLNNDIAYPIMTGAPLPFGYGAVIPVERSTVLSGATDAAGFGERGGQVELPPTEFGSFVREVGEDIAAGEPLASAGALITPALIGSLASQGIGAVQVRSRPKVVLITGGDEITFDTEAEPKPGKILDANGPMLFALATGDGCDVQRVAVGDSVEKLIGVLTRLLGSWEPDLILTSGGISHGKYEVVRLALGKLQLAETTVHVTQSWFGHVSQQPGGPQGLSLLQKGDEGLIPVISVPGNPVSTLVSYVEIVRPALATLTGRRAPEPRHGVLALDADEALQAPVGKTQYRRARIERIFEDDGTVRTLLTPDPLTGSHLLHRAATAQVLVELESGTLYRNGSIARYLPL